MDLNEDDVIQIIRYLDESNFNELRLQLGDLRIVVSRSGNAAPLPDVDPAPAPSDPSAPPVQPAEHPLPAATPGAPVQELPAEEPASSGQRVTINAPMLGTFYRAPEPGAPPFVDVGSVVDEDTTVCIIEVMKLFSTIKAERQGRIARVSVNDGELVEYGQVLFVLEPDAD